MAVPSLVATLRGLVRADHLVAGRLVLREEDPQSTCGEVTLLKGRGDALLLQLDRPAVPVCGQRPCGLSNASNRLIFPLFDATRAGVTALCDFLMFYQRAPDAPVYTLMCELKSSERPRGGAQIKNTSLLADYLVSMAVHHGEVHATPAVHRRGLVFHTGGHAPKGNLHQLPCPFEPLAGSPIHFVQYRPGTYPLEHFCR